LLNWVSEFGTSSVKVVKEWFFIELSLSL
jgi:hypothetical protein